MTSPISPSSTPADTIDAAALARWLAEADPQARPMLLDVREADEWQQGHLPRAVHMPLSELRRQQQPPGELAHAADCVVYCRAGVRSAAAIEWLRQQHGGRLFNLVGGICAWQEAGCDLVQPPPAAQQVAGPASR